MTSRQEIAVALKIPMLKWKYVSMPGKSLEWEVKVGKKTFQIFINSHIILGRNGFGWRILNEIGSQELANIGGIPLTLEEAKSECELYYRFNIESFNREESGAA